jgi:hypothetical protein
MAADGTIKIAAALDDKDLKSSMNGMESEIQTFGTNP